MFFHNKALIQRVNVGKPDAKFGTYLLEQFGGATGELTAALQYWVQSFHVENAAVRTCFRISPLKNSVTSKWSGS
jgi:Mn-containing catalase